MGSAQGAVGAAGRALGLEVFGSGSEGNVEGWSGRLARAFLFAAPVIFILILRPALLSPGGGRFVSCILKLG